jgi:hypothetical protein
MSVTACAINYNIKTKALNVYRCCQTHNIALGLKILTTYTIA